MKLTLAVRRTLESGLVTLFLAAVLACGPLAAVALACHPSSSSYHPSSKPPATLPATKPPTATPQTTTKPPSTPSGQVTATPLPPVPAAPPSPVAQSSPGSPSTVTPVVTPPRPVGAATGSSGPKNPAPPQPPHDNGHVPATVIEGSADVDSPSSSVSTDQPEHGVLGAEAHSRTAESAASQAVPAPVASPAVAAERGQLPFTGLPVIALLVVGAALLAGGVMLRIARASERSDR
jgi:hypothetical protein